MAPCSVDAFDEAPAPRKKNLLQGRQEEESGIVQGSRDAGSMEVALRPAAPGGVSRWFGGNEALRGGQLMPPTPQPLPRLAQT
jgi:hypothetical protein